MMNQPVVLGCVALLGSSTAVDCVWELYDGDLTVDRETAETTGGDMAGIDTEARATEDELTELDISVCDPGKGPFSVDITNPYLSLPAGKQLVLQGDEDGTFLRVEVTALEHTRDVAGVRTRVFEEAKYEDAVLVEISRNFYAQAPDGTVCHFGEAVDVFEDGIVVSHEGQWLTGGNNRPGIIMPADPAPGMMFAQEAAPGAAEDMSAIVALDETETVPVGTFHHVLRTVDWDPLAGETFDDGEIKLYAEGVGLVQDAELVLVEIRG